MIGMIGINGRFRALAAACVAALTAAACNMTTAMTVPDPSGHAEQVEDARIDPHADLAPIAFEKAIAALKRGTPVAHFPAAGNAPFDVSLCNHTYPNDAVMEWGSGTALIGGWNDELAEVFIDTLQTVGYEVVGDPAALFEADTRRRSARYLVAARITDIKGNICEEHHWWDARPLNRYAAEWFLGVEWSVYSTLERRVVATFESDGAARRDQPSAEGVMQAFNDAFADATLALAQQAGFHDLLARDGAARTREATPRDFTPITLDRQALFDAPLTEHIDTSARAVVTVRVGQGHGSGFVIAPEGYVLTNQHVVADAREVAVIFASGMEAIGEVVRTDRARDVALIKVPLRGLTALPVREDVGLKTLDTVYAMGSPVEEDLRSTVTRGVISARRVEPGTGLELIQSDVDISGGNSGGPLMDEYGNVVGVAVSGIGTNKLSSGLNFFIPIDDALTYLGLEFK